MRRHFKIIALISLSFVSIGAAAASTLAWFGTGGNISFGTDADNVNVTGGSVASYYESGTGTELDPFIISNRNHVYNLAWLQYIGYYNDPARNGGEGIQQKYFKVKNDIDLEGLAIPPIGTEIYPFLGNFNGNNCTLSNFIVSNDDPTQDSSDFGVAKPANFYNGEQPEIVGFFGVVGKLPGQNITYTSSVVDVHNITLKDFTVKSETSQTLIGLAAGYVDGTMSGVKVDGDATLDLGNTSKTAKSAITNNLTDYALVGYSTKLAGSGAYSQEISKWYDSNLSDYGGHDLPSYGGTMDVMSLYNRLNSIQTTAIAADTHSIRLQSQSIDANGNASAITTNNVSGTDHLHNYEDNNNYVGSFCFSDEQDYSPGSYEHINLTGRRNAKKEISDYRNSEKLLFINNSYDSYRSLDPVNNETTNVQTYNRSAWSDNPPASIGWYYTNASFDPTDTSTNNSLGALYTIHEGQRYYLYISSFNGSIRARQKILDHVPTEANYLWTATPLNQTTTNCPDGVQKSIYNISARYNNANYYLRSSNALTTTGTGGVNRFVFRIINMPEVSYVPSEIYDNNDTYIPLITEDNSNSAAITNTGYIVSSSNYEPNTSMKSSGMIRVSWFDRSGDHTFNYDIADTSKSTIRTINGGVNNDVLASSVGTYDLFSEKYDDFAPLVNKSNTGSKFYSLRFNETRDNISASDLVTIPKGKLNGQNFTNYNFPRGAINFSLASKGQTIFFAGTYIADAGDFGSFFSLHKVNRSGSNVTSVEEIYQIYRHTSDDSLPYLYKTSASNPSIPSGYELVFDTSWLTNPTSIATDKIYYFQIPLNGGDYALGPVPLKKGANLLYLDIGTNGSEAVDTVSGYSITTHKSSHSYPVGVDFKVVNVGANGGDSMCVVIASSNQGTIQFATTEQVITISGNTSSTYSYQGTKYSGSAASGKFTVSGNSPGSLPPASITSERKIYASVRLATGGLYSIVVADTLNSDSSVASTAFSCNGNSYNNLASLSAVVPPFTSSVLNSLRNLGKAVTLTRESGTAEFNATPAYSVDNRKNVVITMDVGGFSVTASDITDYNIYKESLGQANLMTNGQTYTFS